ncbi:GNAT family N-acetyltransferase [Cerasicoccus arenae]|nr:GNAT family N-acetyltransferase [Cerasicoccus arenae]
MEITRHNIKAVLALEVSLEQKKVYPRSNAYSIAEGHFSADDDPVWMRAIYADETPVGFLMTSEVPEDGIYFLWRIMIDQHHQGRGYGRRAVELLVQRIQKNGNPQYLLTSHLKGDGDAGIFYQGLGFDYTGEVMDETDFMMKLDFQHHEAEQGE